MSLDQQCYACDCPWPLFPFMLLCWRVWLHLGTWLGSSFSWQATVLQKPKPLQAQKVGSFSDQALSLVCQVVADNVCATTEWREGCELINERVLICPFCGCDSAWSGWGPLPSIPFSCFWISRAGCCSCNSQLSCSRWWNSWCQLLRPALFVENSCY